MDMYDNAKIDWHAGMELTSAVFRHWEADLDSRQQLIVRTAIGEGCIGRIPGCSFRAEGRFVERVYELIPLQLTALLPSGRILSVQEEMRLEMPKLSEGTYFLCVGMAEGELHHFERDGVSYERPVHQLSLHTLPELATLDVLPIKRFTVEEGMLSVDQGYLPPALTIQTDEVFEHYFRQYEEQLVAITAHAHLEEGDAKRSLLQLLFRLRRFPHGRSMADGLSLLQEIEQTVTYYLVEGLGHDIEALPDTLVALRQDVRNEPTYYHIRAYLDWLSAYLSVQAELLDRVVLVDNSIDYDALKREIKEELYAQLRKELYDELRTQLHTELTEGLTMQLSEWLRNYIETQLRPRLRKEIERALCDSLYQRLYDALYDALSELLYKPETQEEDEFIPLI